MSKVFVKNMTVVRAGRIVLLSVLVCLIFAFIISRFAKARAEVSQNYPPAIQELIDFSDSDEAFRTLLDKAFKEAITSPDICLEGNNIVYSNNRIIIEK